VLSHEDTRASVVLKSGRQVDLRFVPLEGYGAALHYFTGSKVHNIAVRKLGQARRLKVKEYGVFRGWWRVASNAEGSVFAVANLPWVPPDGKFPQAMRSITEGLFDEPQMLVRIAN